MCTKDPDTKLQSLCNMTKKNFAKTVDRTPGLWYNVVTTKGEPILHQQTEKERETMKKVYVMTMTEDEDYVRVFKDLNGVAKELNELASDYCAWTGKTDDELKEYLQKRDDENCVYLLNGIDEPGTPFADYIAMEGLEVRHLPIE